jgi:hypothetical protein
MKEEKLLVLFFAVVSGGRNEERWVLRSPQDEVK